MATPVARDLGGAAAPGRYLVTMHGVRRAMAGAAALGLLLAVPVPADADAADAAVPTPLQRVVSRLG